MTLTLAGLTLWMAILLLQNASFTMVSRARNSGNDWYHAWGSVASNGVWFIAFYLTWGYLDFLHALQPFGSLREFGLTVLILIAYIIPTVTGSVFMGKFLRRFVEKGNRQVGHYDAKADQIASLEGQVRMLARVLDDHMDDEKQRASKVALKGRLKVMRDRAAQGSDEDDGEQPAGQPTDVFDPTVQPDPVVEAVEALFPTPEDDREEA